MMGHSYTRWLRWDIGVWFCVPKAWAQWAGTGLSGPTGEQGPGQAERDLWVSPLSLWPAASISTEFCPSEDSA